MYSNPEEEIENTNEGLLREAHTSVVEMTAEVCAFLFDKQNNLIMTKPVKKRSKVTILLTGIIVALMTITSAVSCRKKNTPTPITQINEGNDPNFKIVEHTDQGLSSFNRKVVVFGIDIYAASRVEDTKLLHAANLMAQYLDNDEDGTIDNQKVVDAMITNKAFLFLWKFESDILSSPPPGREGQDLGNDETILEWHTNKSGAFDAALEEVWHIITHTGYASAYPSIFGEVAETKLAKAMDTARGGHFTTIPPSYPKEVWYSYDDATCNYSCMATEYFYWSMSSILGAQANRLNDIQQEWKLNTKDLVQSKDIAIYQLLTDPQYKLPKILPDGTYKR